MVRVSPNVQSPKSPQKDIANVIRIHDMAQLNKKLFDMQLEGARLNRIEHLLQIEATKTEEYARKERSEQRAVLKQKRKEERRKTQLEASPLKPRRLPTPMSPIRHTNAAQHVIHSQAAKREKAARALRTEALRASRAEAAQAEAIALQHIISQVEMKKEDVLSPLQQLMIDILRYCHLETEETLETEEKTIDVLEELHTTCISLGHSTHWMDAVIAALLQDPPAGSQSGVAIGTQTDNKDWGSFLTERKLDSMVSSRSSHHSAVNHWAFFNSFSRKSDVSKRMSSEEELLGTKKTSSIPKIKKLQNSSKHLTSQSTPKLMPNSKSKLSPQNSKSKLLISQNSKTKLTSHNLKLTLSPQNSKTKLTSQNSRKSLKRTSLGKVTSPSIEKPQKKHYTSCCIS